MAWGKRVSWSVGVVRVKSRTSCFTHRRSLVRNQLCPPSSLPHHGLLDGGRGVFGFTTGLAVVRQFVRHVCAPALHFRRTSTSRVVAGALSNILVIRSRDLIGGTNERWKIYRVRNFGYGRRVDLRPSKVCVLERLS